MAPEAPKTRVLLDKDIELNPKCVHGPMLEFVRGADHSSSKFVCSACRNPKDCPGPVVGDEQAYEDRNLREHFDCYAKSSETSKYFCDDCSVLCNDQAEHNRCAIKVVTDKALMYPTRILPPNSRDKTEAQYFFDQETVDQICGILKDLKYNKTICMGTPRLHEHLRQLANVQSSLLLDFDPRLMYFYHPDELLRYNMFNHYFFCGDFSKRVFSEFLKNNTDRDRAILIVDPPFGCRTEVLSYTIKRIQLEYLALNQEILSVLWIFPYFMENYVVKSMPEMTMLDFKVNYTNHKTYNDSGRFGSPVRLFTNILPKLIKFKTGFKFCNECQMFTRVENVHCYHCKACPSKNGAVYRHCPNCLICVKPYYVHCFECNRCAQKEGHNCQEYQLNTFCWICDEKGHIERNCPWIPKKKAMDKRMKNQATKSRICVICHKPNHNEKHCRRRQDLLEMLH